MAKSPPSYDFYPGDYSKSTRTFSLEHHGMFRLLLDEQWEHGIVPSSPEKLMRICGISSRDRFDKLWETVRVKFKVVSGGLKNPRMDIDRQKANESYQNRARNARKNGLKGGRPQKTDIGLVENPQWKGEVLLKDKKNSRASETRVELPYSSTEYRAAWDAYMEVRRQAKYTMTKYAINLIAGKLRKMDEPGGIEALNGAVVGKWKTLYAPSKSAELAEQEAKERAKQKRRAETAQRNAEDAARRAMWKEQS